MGFEIKNSVLMKYNEESDVIGVIIPDSVTSIGKETFYGCDNLTSVIIGKGLTSIENIPCSYLEEIIVSPDNMHLMSKDNVVYDKSGTKLLGRAGKKKDKFTIF